MTQKFHPRLQGIQSATGENLTEAAQIADKWKGYCEDLYCDEEGKGIEQEYWEQEPAPLRSEVARAICQTASCKATGLVRSQQNCSKQERRYWTECTEYVWRSGKLVSGQRNGRSPRSSHFPRNTHTHPLKGPLSRTTRVNWYQKGQTTTLHYNHLTASFPGQPG